MSKSFALTLLSRPGQFAAVAAGSFLLCLLLSAPAHPAGETAAIASLNALLGLPYRDDGTTDPAGRFTLFARPEATFTTPGLNCSGFVMTASRALLRRAPGIEAARRDRKGDSGPDSPRGADWDFGFDLILNLTAGLPRTVLLPSGAAPDPERADPASLRGFPLHDAKAWAAVLPRITPGTLTLAALSKERAGRLLFYHVGLLVADGPGRVFLYHATPGTGSHRLELTARDGMAAFEKEFAEKRFGDKWILLVSVPLPR